MRRALAAGTIAALTVAGALAPALSPASAEQSAQQSADRRAPTAYVALGDSYSAASGVLPVDVGAPQCLRSTRNYPRVMAAELGAALTDVSCGGADTADFSAEQYPGTAPQLDALSPSTELVTMTIGGNDSGVFTGAILSCLVAGVPALGQGDPCQRQYGTSFEDTVRTTTYPALVAALTAVHERAPQARVAILGYPWIVPETRGCFPQMPVARGDVPYLRSLQATLNDAVARAAAATGTLYVDLGAASNGRDACQPLGTRWVEPVLLGTNPVVVHPNARGEAGMAARALEELGRQPACAGIGPGACAALAAPAFTKSSTRTRLGVTTRGRVSTVRARVSTPGTRKVRQARVVVQRRAGSSWVTVRRVGTGADGTATLRVRPGRTTTYRAVFRGNVALGPSTSPRVTLRR